MELNLKILAPLLQCTSIDRCALFMRANIYIYIYIFIYFNPYPIKILPLSLSLSLSLSTLIISPLSLSLNCLITASPPPHCRPMPPAHAADRRHQPISPLFFFFFFFSMGCGVVVVVVVWVDRHQWVAGFNVCLNVSNLCLRRPQHHRPKPTQALSCRSTPSQASSHQPKLMVELVVVSVVDVGLVAMVVE